MYPFHVLDDAPGPGAFFTLSGIFVEQIDVANRFDMTAVECCDEFPFPGRDVTDDIGHRHVVEDSRQRHVAAHEAIERIPELSPVIVDRGHHGAFTVFH